MMAAAITEMSWVFAVVFISVFALMLGFVAMWIASHHHS
jgi:hypothetical protein